MTVGEVWYNIGCWGEAFDPETGECLAPGWFEQRAKYTEGYEYIQPLDISKIKTEQELRDYGVCFYDGKWLSVRGPLDVTSMVCDWELKSSELKVLTYLGKEENVCHHSYCVADMEDMRLRTGLKRSTMYKTLKALEDKAIIKATPCKLEEKNKKVFEVQPWFCWRGWGKMRSKRILEWFEFEYQPFKDFSPDAWMLSGK